MRLIDADALWQALYDIGGCDAADIWADGWDKAINEALNLVEAAPTVAIEPLRWIPVTERLPAIGHHVLVYRNDRVNNYGGRYITIASLIQQERQIWTECGLNFMGVTHWSELPEPPKEEKP